MSMIERTAKSKAPLGKAAGQQEALTILSLGIVLQVEERGKLRPAVFSQPSQRGMDDAAAFAPILSPGFDVGKEF